MKAIRLVEHVIPGKRLGRHIEHDPRSKKFPFVIRLSPNVLRTTRHRRLGVFDQGDVGSCTGEAVTGAMNTFPIHKKGTKLKTQADAVKAYARATAIDDFPGSYPPDDTGSSGLAAAKAAQQFGWINGYRHAFSVEEAVAALMARPVITGVNWYEGFDDPDHTGLVKIDGQARGGHEFEVVSFVKAPTFDESILVAVNSWGAGWGLHGRFRFTVATWRRLLEEDGDVTVLQ